MPFIHLFSWSCKKSAQSISRSTKAWKIKHYWQTQIVLILESDVASCVYKRWRRNLIRHASSLSHASHYRPNPTSHGSKYGKQLVSSAIWRWPSQNINFFCVFFFSPSNIIRRRPAEAPCCSNTLLLIAGIHFLFQFNVTVSKAILMPNSPQDTSVKTASANQIKIQINRGKKLKSKYDK